MTVKDWQQTLAPNIQAEIMSQTCDAQRKIEDIQQTYIKRSEYTVLEAEFHSLKNQFNEVMQILALKGLVSEEDIKEFRDSRKLAAQLAIEEKNRAAAGFISSQDKTKLDGIVAADGTIAVHGNLVLKL